MGCQPSKCKDCNASMKACQLIGGRCSSCHGKIKK